MPDNTLITMDDLTNFTTDLKTILDSQYSGGGSSKIDSGWNKISDFLSIENLNDAECEWYSDTGILFADISNNKQCCFLYKEGNIAHYVITNGFTLTIPANTIFQDDSDAVFYFNSLPQSFCPTKLFHGTGHLIYKCAEERDPMLNEPITFPIQISPYDYYYGNSVIIYFPKTSLLSNNSNKSMTYTFYIDVFYPLT